MVLDVGAVAHGGHCVARADGQVVFVRHALPGETVRAVVTSLGPRGRFVRADAKDVLAAAPGRRVPPCPVAERCGGCDWQHAEPAAARALKADVVRASMRRFAGLELPAEFEVAEVAAPEVTASTRPAGLGWRTRGRLAVDGAGRAGFRAPRSHEVVVTPACPQLDARLDDLDVFGRRWPPGRSLGLVAPALGAPVVFPGEEPPREPVVEHADGTRWEVAADGFWQVHPEAADALVGQVRRMLAPRPGERLVDLYAGVGLFGLSLARGVAGDLSVTLVESDRRACALAARNAGSLLVSIVHAAVDRWAGRADTLAGADLVVLDPPRVGAGASVVRAVAACRPRAVGYVACDPVALARDLATFRAEGYELVELVAVDLFPTTHHVECVAELQMIS